MKQSVVAGVALLASLIVVAPARAAQSASVDLKAIWNSLTPEEQAAYKAEGRRLAAPSYRGLLVPGDTCAAATFESGALPYNDANTTVGLTDDLTYGAACGGFNSESGVGPDIAYKIQTDITCDLTVTMDPAANDLALWVVTDCGDPVGGCVGGDDSGGSGTAEVVGPFTATAGTPLFVVVDGFAGASDSFTLNIAENTATGCALVGGPPGYASAPAPPGPIDVGSVPVGGTGSVDLTISEIGAADLTVSNPVIAGTNAADFAIEPVFPLTIIDGGAAVPVEVSCTPTAPGSLTATLALDTNDPTQASVNYDLTCDGSTTPAPGYGSTPAPPGPIAIDSVPVGGTGSVDLTISETGTEDLIVSKPVIAGTNAANFAIEQVFPLTIVDGGEMVPVEVSCTPTAEGSLTATLTLDTNDPTEASVNYDLTCEAVPDVPALAFWSLALLGVALAVAGTHFVLRLG